MSARAEWLPWERFSARWSPETWDAWVADRRPTPFLAFDWLDAWRAAFTPNLDRAGALVGERDGAVRAVLFLARADERYGPVPLRVLTPFRNTHCERAAILTDGAEEADLTALAEGLRVLPFGWDVLRLGGVPTGTALPKRLCAAAGREGLRAHLVRHVDNVVLPVEGDFDTVYRRIRKKKRQDQQRLTRRLAEAAGDLSHHRLQGRDAAGEGLRIYFDLEEKSWKRMDGEVIADRAPLLRFYRDVAERFTARDRLEVMLLRAGGTPISAMVSLRFGDRLLTLKTAYDETWQRFTPAWPLWHGVFEDAFARGLKMVDTYGKLRFLETWSDARATFADLLIFAPTARGRLAERLWRLRSGQEDRLTPRDPDRQTAAFDPPDEGRP